MKNYLLLLFLLPFAACTKNDDAPVAKDLYPLAVGNYWIYDRIDYNPDGSVISTTSPDYSVTVTGEGTKDGFFIMHSETDVEAHSTPTQLITYDPGSGEETVEYTIPEKIDTTNITQDENYLTYTITYPDKSNVAGYSCYRYEYHYYDLTNQFIGKTVFYIAPGIGEVRMDDMAVAPASEGGELYIWLQHNLIDYHINE